jgi:hypothetical protein
MDMHNNIKADKAATIKWRINPPHLSLGFSNGQVGQLLRKSMGDYDCVANIVAWKFPTGPTRKYSGLRIQIAVKGVNGFVKAMRRKTESQPEC